MWERGSDAGRERGEDDEGKKRGKKAEGDKGMLDEGKKRSGRERESFWEKGKDMMKGRKRKTKRWNNAGRGKEKEDGE